MYKLNGVRITQKGTQMRAEAEFQEIVSEVKVFGRYNLTNSIGLDRYRKLGKALGKQGKLTHDCIARVHDGDLSMFTNKDKEFQIETEYDDFYKEDVVKSVYLNASFNEALTSIRL